MWNECFLSQLETAGDFFFLAPPCSPLCSSLTRLSGTGELHLHPWPTQSLRCFLSLRTSGRESRRSPAKAGIRMRHSSHHGSVLLFFPKLYFRASCSRIKCFLLLNHIMHLPGALLRFSLWGIVCVKPTELKVLQHLLSLTPGRQSGGRPFCILAAKCEKVRWRQKVQGLATLSFSITGLHTSTIICEAGTLALETFYI